MIESLVARTPGISVNLYVEIWLVYGVIVWGITG